MTLVRALRAWAWAERGRFANWLPVCMGLGALLYFGLSVEPAWYVAAGLVAGTLAILLLLRASPPGRMAASALFACALGFAAGQVSVSRTLPVVPLPLKAVTVSGRVAAVEALPDGGRRLTIAAPLVALAPKRADGPPDPGQTIARSVHLRLRADDNAMPVSGDQVRVRALLRPPSAPSYPGARDGRFEAYFSGLAASGFALGPAEIVSHDSAGGLMARVDAWREAIAAHLLASMEPRAGPIAATLLVGEGQAIGQDDRASFADAGLSHILAVAGLHIGIVMGLFLAASRFLLLRSERLTLRVSVRTVSALVALAAGGVYLLMTGAHVPIVRSFAMACLFTLALALGRRPVSMRGWALAACAILLVAPEQVLGVSFQMSFAAVLALIAGYEALRGPLARLRGEGGRGRRLAVHVVMLSLTSLLAGGASAPFAAYHFGHVQPWFILANLLAVPITALWVMPLGLISLALMPVGLDWLTLVPMGWGIEAIRGLAGAVAALPVARIAVPQGPGWGLLLVALGLAWLCLWRTRLRLAGLVPLTIGLCAPALVARADILVSGDARLIGVHDGRAMLLRRHGGGSRYDEAAWSQYWAASEGPASAATCGDDGRCRIGDVLLLRGDEDEAVPEADCRGVRLVVSAAPAGNACQGAPVVDRFTVWREGPAAIWLGAYGPVVVTASGSRPWVALGRAAKARRVELPVAVAE